MLPRYLIWFRLTAPTVLAVPGAPLAFHVMAKPTGVTCNLDCEYCFFCPRRCCTRAADSGWPPDLQETYLRQLLEAHALAPKWSSPGGAAGYRDPHTARRDFDGLVRLVKATWPRNSTVTGQGGFRCTCRRVRRPDSGRDCRQMKTCPWTSPPYIPTIVSPHRMAQR